MSQTLYVVCGYPGVGKSTASKYIQEQTDASRFATDKIRKELFGPDPSYSSEESQATYDELFSRAESELSTGTTVVLDATFSLASGRNRARTLANQTGSECVFVFVECNSSTVRERIQERSDSLSDADFSVHQKIRDTWEPFEQDYKSVDNSASVTQLENQIDELL